MIPKNLGELLSISAQRHHYRVAIAFGQKKITYKTLNELATRFASGLVKLGIKKNDKVALLLDNCPHFVISYYAVLKAGGVVVPINFMFKIEEVKFILEDSLASTVITSGPYVEMAEELRLRVDTLKNIITTSKIKDGLIDCNSIATVSTEILDKISIDPDDLAVILYTSGTTGHPKGAMLTHYNLISNACDSACAITITHRDTFLCVLPLFHSFAATVCMNLPLLIGAKIVILKSMRPFHRAVRAIRKNRVTVFAAIPSIYNILKDIKLPKIFNTPLIKLFNPVRICISGAAALPVETFNAFEKKFRIPLLEGYGLTEASPVVTLNPLKGVRKPGSIGIPLSKNIALKIVDEAGNALRQGETGELLVKGPNVMRGYYRQEEATASALKDGWLYTGDMAKFDSDGYFYIVDRKKEMVNVRGLNVYPREIEEVLYQNPKIKEAAVIGIPDIHKGEVPLGFVVLKEQEKATEREIMHYLRERLASYKVPKYIEFRASLPKNATGKILKRILKEEIDKIKFLVIFALIAINLSCATLKKDMRYYEAVEEARIGNKDFAFLELNDYLRDNPNSIYAPQIKFAICEYYLENKDYRDAIDQLTRYVIDYSEEKNIVFAQAILYKTLMEYRQEPQLVEKIKEVLFSKSIFLLFSESKTKHYKSILNNTYKIVDYVNKIEVFKNGELILEITP